MYGWTLGHLLYLRYLKSNPKVESKLPLPLTTTHYYYRENHASIKTWDFCPSMIPVWFLHLLFFLSDTHGIGGSLTNVVKPSKKHWVNLPSAPSGVYLDGNSAGPSEDTHYGRPINASPIVNLIPQHHSASIPRSKPLLWGILVY